MNKIRNDLFIEFKYNGREITGIDEFKSELEKSYHCQGRDNTLPAYSEGGETWFTLFINSPFFDFTKDLIVSGMAWDLLKSGTKSYVLKPFVKALENLETANENSFKLRIVKMKLQFDDITVVFGGLQPKKAHVIGLVFDAIIKHQNVIKSHTQTEISTIETPLFYNPSVDKKGYSPYSLETHPANLEDYLREWKVYSMHDRYCTIYNLKEKSFKEAYPN